MDNNQKKAYEFDLQGVPFKLETGEIANLAQSSFLISYGETSALIVLTVGEANPELDFFPLTVEYVEKHYAGGFISSSPYIKREGRPTDREILNARLIDHAIRSLFPSDFRNEVQVIVQILSYDKVHDPVLASMVGISFMLSSSGLPFKGPYGVSKLGYIDGQIKLNPNLEKEKQSELEIFVSSVKDGIVSVEAEAHNLPDELIKEAIQKAHEANLSLISEQEKFLEKVGKKHFDFDEKAKYESDSFFAEIEGEFVTSLESAIYKVNKQEREAEIKKVQKIIVERYEAKIKNEEITEGKLKLLAENLAKKIVRKNIMTSGKRADGRDLNEVREITARVGLLPRTHGSSLFSRGETQTLTIVTLGTDRDALQFQSLEGDESKKYFHHYNMPGYANGEVDRKFGFPNRRAIGHGAIGEKALKNMLPNPEEFPYTIRVVSEVVSSNGSTSMAATCGSTLALMDAGIKIKEIVGGVGVGLVYESESEYKILTDIIGLEDFYGDMDFKITGTRSGITAIQLDNKMAGIPVKVLFEAMDRSKEGRFYVISEMEKSLATPRNEISKHAPRVKVMKIAQEKIGELIGPGGKMIKSIIEKTGVEINIVDDGTVYIYADQDDKFSEAMGMILPIMQQLVEGDEYDAQIIRVEEYGVFIELAQSKIQGLVHVSNLGKGFVKEVDKVVKLGERVKVKYIGKDQKGRVKFAITKYLDQVESAKTQSEHKSQNNEERAN